VLPWLRSELGLAPVLSAEREMLARPEDPERRFQLAAACAAAGDPVGAALALYPLATSDPPNHAALLAFAEHCTRVGWLDEGAAALRRLSPAPARARLDLAAATVRRGEAARASAILAPMLWEPLTAEEWIDGAITAYHCRRPKEAIAWAEKAAAAAPASTPARAVLARCLLAAGRPEAAINALGDDTSPTAALWRARAEVRCRDAARRKAGRALLARLAGQTADPAAAFESGRALLEAGDAGTALPLLSRAAVRGYQEPLCYALLARAYSRLLRHAEADWARGRALLLRGRYAEAAAALRASVARDPARPMASVDLARALHAEGKLGDAVAILERAQRVTPGDLDVRLMKAKLLLGLERPDAVVRELTAAAALDPRRANEPLGNLGTVYFDSQQYDRAVPVLQEAVRREDGDAHAHFYLGRTHARYAEEPARAEDAVRHLVRAARLQPDYSRPWMLAASLLQRATPVPYPSEAAACLCRAIGGDSHSDAPYVPLARILQQQGRVAERRWLLKRYAATRDHDLRRTSLEKETREHPADAPRRFALGEILLREGRPEKALPELLAATGMRPAWRDAQLRLADVCALLGFDDLRAEAERAAR
jgi:predicted Zn-dependent protease